MASSDSASPHSALTYSSTIDSLLNNFFDLDNMKNWISVTWHWFFIFKKNYCQTTPLEMQGFHPTAALPPASESCFSFRPLKSERRGPYRSQSEAGRPQCCSSQPLGLYEGGIMEASACVAAIVYQETRDWLNNPPVNTAIQWETRKWQDPRDLHTHMPFPWSWRIALVLFGRYKEEEKGTARGAC